ncbi:MAG: UDP-N-acetylmuramoyl-tripeptide--D-alanyl-D-alanine ligase [Opitutales bacterium]|nr:UDP-N-acetylmuramoyl-tripeptide--D-alanyl-D-alanine ligase [Opitutales bacterium]
MPIFDPDKLEKWSCGTWKDTPKEGISGFSIDSRNLHSGDLFVAIKAERNGHDFLSSAKENGACAGIVENVKLDIQLPQLLVQDSLQAFHQIAHQHRLEFKGEVVGITGSCGKTSTKDILGLLLGEGNALCTEGNLNNHLGVPLTLLRCDNNKHKFAVVEAGINQLGEMSMLAETISPNLVLVTIVAPSHLEGLGTVENIASEKADLFTRSDSVRKVIFPEDCLLYEKFSNLYNTGDGLVVLREGEPNSEPSPIEAFYSIWTETNKIGGSSLLRLWRHGSPSFSFSLPYLSKGMGKNAALAVLAALELGVSVQEISERLPRFRPSTLRGRCFQGRGRSYLVDCYNANPASMKDSIEFFKNQFTDSAKLYVLAGMEELGEGEKKLHHSVGQCIELDPTDLIILIGEKATWIAPALLEKGYSESQIIVLSEINDAVSLVEDFDGAVLFKGSRTYQLEKLLPAWAVEKNENGTDEQC